MRFTALSRHAKRLSRLCALPLLALVFLSPAAAEPSTEPPSAQNSGSAPSAEAELNSGSSGSQSSGSRTAPSADPKPSTQPPSAQNSGSAPSAEAASPPTQSAEAEPKSAPNPDPQPSENSGNSSSAGATTNPSPAQPKAGAPATQSGSASAKPGSEPPAKQPGSQILVNIDKAQQEMTVFINGIEHYSWPISTGRRGYSTPSGSYTASSMNDIWYSKEWDNAPMYNAIFFTKKGHAIHGTDEEKFLGKPASHGCVRVSRANAKTLFALVKTNGLSNTQVVLTGTTPGGEAKVAKRPVDPRYGEADPWFGPGQGYFFPPGYERPRPGYEQPPPRRRGLFGGWFRRDDRPRDYYGGSRRYYPPY
jgi:lipoprotein-anchoring transpeptidase ErfK/SrfK